MTTKTKFKIMKGVKHNNVKLRLQQHKLKYEVT